MWPGCRRPRRGPGSRPGHLSVATALAGALDDWAAIRRDKRKDAAGAASLSQAAQIADPDPWRTDLRNALDEPDKAARLTRLQAVEKKANYDALGPISLHLLGSGLIEADDPALAESVLRKAQERHPRDVWINYVLGRRWRNSRAATRRSASTPPRARSGPRRPTSWPMPWRSGAIATRPSPSSAISADYVPAMPGISVAWARRSRRLAGRTRPRRRSKPPSSRAARRSGSSPSSAYAHSNLGNALKGKGQVDEAIACYQKAIELDPKLAAAHNNLGIALQDKGQLDEAIACYRKAIELDPKLAEAHSNLGNALDGQGPVGRGHRLLPARPSNSTRSSPGPGLTWRRPNAWQPSRTSSPRS